MVWGYRPDDSLATQQLPQVDATMPFAVVGDEDLGSTQILTDQPAKHLGAHRRPPREVLTWRQTGVTAAALGALVFGAVWALSGSDSPAPEAVRQAAPDAPVATTSLTPAPTPTVKRPVVRPAEPVVRRQDRPAPVSPVHTVVITVAAKPKATTTPTPKSTSSSPKPTATPEPTSPGPVETSETADPDEDPTPATEATDGDS